MSKTPTIRAMKALMVLKFRRPILQEPSTNRIISASAVVLHVTSAWPENIQLESKPVNSTIIRSIRQHVTNWLIKYDKRKVQGVQEYKKGAQGKGWKKSKRCKFLKRKVKATHQTLWHTTLQTPFYLNRIWTGSVQFTHIFLISKIHSGYAQRHDVKYLIRLLSDSSKWSSSSVARETKLPWHVIYEGLDANYAAFLYPFLAPLLPDTCRKGGWGWGWRLLRILYTTQRKKRGSVFKL